MRLSDIITNEIMRMLNESEINTAEIQRNEFAALMGCAPSQINYVLSSRFTPEHGYIIESGRGGGGYIRIKRITLNHTSAIMLSLRRYSHIAGMSRSQSGMIWDIQPHRSLLIYASRVLRPSSTTN